MHGGSLRGTGKQSSLLEDEIMKLISLIFLLEKPGDIFDWCNYCGPEFDQGCPVNPKLARIWPAVWALTGGCVACFEFVQRMVTGLVEGHEGEFVPRDYMVKMFEGLMTLPVKLSRMECNLL